MGPGHRPGGLSPWQGDAADLQLFENMDHMALDSSFTGDHSLTVGKAAREVSDEDLDKIAGGYREVNQQITD